MLDDGRASDGVNFKISLNRYCSNQIAAIISHSRRMDEVICNRIPYKIVTDCLEWGQGVDGIVLGKVVQYASCLQRGDFEQWRLIIESSLFCHR